MYTTFKHFKLKYIARLTTGYLIVNPLTPQESYYVLSLLYVRQRTINQSQLIRY